MSNTQTKNSKVKIFAVIGFTLSLFIGFFPGAANAAETALNMGTASTYGALASATVTSDANASGISGTAGGDLGVGGGTAPTGTITRTGSTILGGASLAALTAASNALADNRGGTSTPANLSGTYTPGAYTYSSGLTINGTLTLDAQGVSSAVFIFRAASTLITAISSTVLLTGGAQACNVFWQIGSSATLGTSSTIVGHVIAYASVSTGASTTVNGQLIGTTGSVTLGGTTIVNNSCTTPTPTPVVTPTPTPTPAVTLTPTPVVEVIEPVVETATGGKLPKTSTPLGNILLVGGALILLSGIGFASRDVRVK